MTDARVDVIRRLARRGAGAALQRALDKSRAEDIAEAIAHLAPAEGRRVMDSVSDDEVAAGVLAELDDSDLQLVVSGMEFPRLVKLLELMEVDDEADIIYRLPDELREQVLDALKAEEQRMVEDILAWPDDSAGGIMQPLAFRLHEDTTCRDAITALHEQQEDLEMVFYLYVENASDQLVGVLSLRALLIHAPSTPISDIMTADVITVTADTDQEEVARIVSRYDLLAIPVVDESRRLLGIVTVDDIVDVIKEEAIEDMMLMAGVSEDAEASGGSVFTSARKRFTWLGVTLVGGIAMAELIGFFEGALAKQAVLAGFIPVMLGMGGNVGIQAATVAVRNIALGRIQGTGIFSQLFRETRVGFLIGIGFAVTLGGYAFLRWQQQPLIGTAVAISIIITVVAAAAIGTMVPLTLNRLGVDPAIATGPFVTTSIDVAAIFIYFSTSVLIIGL